MSFCSTMRRLAPNERNYGRSFVKDCYKCYLQSDGANQNHEQRIDRPSTPDNLVVVVVVSVFFFFFFLLFIIWINVIVERGKRHKHKHNYYLFPMFGKFNKLFAFSNCSVLCSIFPSISSEFH